jgi:hypothetical protein
MSEKQRVNDKCRCGSGKKYKKCCLNKTQIELPPHTVLPPKSFEQMMVRQYLEKKMENIKEPHCKICGDTEKNGKIMKIPTQNNDIYLCEFCYNVQINM